MGTWGSARAGVLSRGQEALIIGASVFNHLRQLVPAAAEVPHVPGTAIRRTIQTPSSQLLVRALRFEPLVPPRHVQHVRSSWSQYRARGSGQQRSINTAVRHRSQVPGKDLTWLRLDVPDMKSHQPDGQECQVKTEKNAERLPNSPPRDWLHEKILPGIQVISEEPMLQIAKVGNLL